MMLTNTNVMGRTDHQLQCDTCGSLTAPRSTPERAVNHAYSSFWGQRVDGSRVTHHCGHCLRTGAVRWEATRWQHAPAAGA